MIIIILFLLVCYSHHQTVVLPSPLQDLLGEPGANKNIETMFYEETLQNFADIPVSNQGIPNLETNELPRATLDRSVPPHNQFPMRRMGACVEVAAYHVWSRLS